MDCMEFIEKNCNVKLLLYQKEIVKMLLSKGEIYVCYPPRIGYSYYLKMIEEVRNISYGGRHD